MEILDKFKKLCRSILLIVFSLITTIVFGLGTSQFVKVPGQDENNMTLNRTKMVCLSPVSMDSVIYRAIEEIAIPNRERMGYTLYCGVSFKDNGPGKYPDMKIAYTDTPSVIYWKDGEGFTGYISFNGLYVFFSKTKNSDKYVSKTDGEIIEIPYIKKPKAKPVKSDGSVLHSRVEDYVFYQYINYIDGKYTLMPYEYGLYEADW